MRKTGFWIAVIGILLLISAVVLVLAPWGKAGNTAVIRHNGEILHRIDLSAVKESYTFSVDGSDGKHNEVTVEKNRICVSAANCPDQVCVHQGWIGSSGIPVVCLPHGLVIEITGGENGPDIILK